MLKATKNKNGIKPVKGFGGWEYPGTGYVFPYFNTMGELISAVKVFEKANELKPIPDLEDDLEDFMCKTCSVYGQFCTDVTPVMENIMNRVTQIISGTKAILKIKAKSETKSLKVLPIEDAQSNARKCNNCNLNIHRGYDKHEATYKDDIAKAYGVSDIKEVEFDEHRLGLLGTCNGCGCKIGTKLYLHEENYGVPLVENVHAINDLLRARIKHGSNVCWQLERVFLPEHLKVMLERGRIRKKDLKTWGYI